MGEDVPNQKVRLTRVVLEGINLVATGTLGSLTLWRYLKPNPPLTRPRRVAAFALALVGVTASSFIMSEYIIEFQGRSDKTLPGLRMGATIFIECSMIVNVVLTGLQLFTPFKLSRGAFLAVTILAFAYVAIKLWPFIYDVLVLSRRRRKKMNFSTKYRSI